MEIPVLWRDLQPVDLPALSWSGGLAHIKAVRAALKRCWAGEVELVVAELPNQALVAMGGLDLTRRPGVGWMWMLSVHEAWQGLGLGTRLIGELEDRCRAGGLDGVALSVEHDNPRAAALYRRLGYAEEGSIIETWPTEDGGTWVTTCTSLHKSLRD